MTRSRLLLIVLMTAVSLRPAFAQTTAAFTYPPPPKDNTVDTYFGTSVPDPYRPLEDLDSPQTRAWVEAENKTTFAYLDTLPTRAFYKKRLTQVIDYERYGLPFHEGGQYFYGHNRGLQNQSVLYTQTSLYGTPRVLFDPNKLSKDGTVAIRAYSVSRDGKTLAYTVSDAGSDWETVHVRDVATGKDRPDVLQWSKFSQPSWSRDGSGFYYSRFPKPKAATLLKDASYYQTVYYHKLGTPQAQDTLVYGRPDHKDWYLSGGATDDGRYLILTIEPASLSPKNGVYYKDLRDKTRKTVELLNTFDASYSFLDNDGPVFWFQTDLNAPRGRVIAIDIRHPQKRFWKDLIPQTGDTISGVSVVGNRFIVSYLHDAHTVVKVFGLTGRFKRTIPLPGIGVADGFGGHRTDKETFFAYTGFAAPVTIYRYEIPSARTTLFRKSRVAFDPNQYETKQVFFPSKDGTRISLFLVYKRGLKLNGANPTLLYGYGGFDISNTPYFDPFLIPWMDRGGVYASAILRGGGEYGETWHQAGTKAKKQNVFDDFIACAQWLLDNKYTSTPKLAINGASNGGLLIGACLTQRPDLFGAAIPEVGVLDMLRFQKFTVGWGWVSDYGSSDNASDFPYLYKYSPLQNVKPGTSYPPTLILTADHDDRVFPAHSFKFAAALQAAQSGPAPVLIRIETRAGHGSGKPITKVIDETADKYAFLEAALGMDADGTQ